MQHSKERFVTDQQVIQHNMPSGASHQTGTMRFNSWQSRCSQGPYLSARAGVLFLRNHGLVMESRRVIFGAKHIDDDKACIGWIQGWQRWVWVWVFTQTEPSWKFSAELNRTERVENQTENNRLTDSQLIVLPSMAGPEFKSEILQNVGYGWGSWSFWSSMTYSWPYDLF